MASKSVATLTSDLASNITGQTTPESITPTIDGAERQDIIDSFWNRIDDTFLPASSQSAVLNPAAMTGASALMMGLAQLITPVRTGKVLINISGEFVSDDTASDTVFSIRTGTGAAPSNGDAVSGTALHATQRLASSTTLRIPFSLNCIATLTPAVQAWIDMSCANNSSTSVQLFNVSVSIIEQ